MIFGYMRISTQKEKQTTDRQRITLEQYASDNGFKFDEIVEERISGTVKAENRPQFNQLKAKMRADDILIITDGISVYWNRGCIAYCRRSTVCCGLYPACAHA